MKTFTTTKWVASIVIQRRCYLAYIQTEINNEAAVYAAAVESHLH